jgi:hypothetical protein
MTKSCSLITLALHKKFSESPLYKSLVSLNDVASRNNRNNYRPDPRLEQRQLNVRRYL